MNNCLKPPRTQQRPKPFITQHYLFFNVETRATRFDNQQNIAGRDTEHLAESGKRIDARKRLAVFDLAQI
nr:hypothetical protein [Pseudomonas yangonensis]